MKGFFKIKDVPGNTGVVSRKAKKIEPTKYMIPGEPICGECGLDKVCKHPKIEVGGRGNKNILVICEAPGEVEDIKGEALVGPVGQFLTKGLREKLDIELNRDCWKINALNCRPPDNDEPTDTQLKCCLPYVLKTIQEINPDHIWLFGDAAIQQFIRLQGLWGPKLKMSRWMRWHIPVYKYGAWVSCAYHPSWVIRKQSPAKEAFFGHQLKFLGETLGKSLPAPLDFDKQIKILSKKDDILGLLGQILTDKPLIAHDYETTSLKPHKPEQRIDTIGVCFNEEEAFSFPLMRPNYWDSRDLRQIQIRWKKILEDPDIALTAHNMKFEESWGHIKIGADIKGWVHCTQVGTHTLNETPDTKGLKFQAFVNYGLEDYSREIEPFLKSDGKSGHEMNTVEEAPITPLLKYNGVDALINFLLYHKQMEVFGANPDLENARRLGMRASLALCAIEYEGIPIDVEYFEGKKVELDTQAVKLIQGIMTSSEAEAFQKKYRHEFNITSNDDLVKMFYELKGNPVLTKTNKGAPSTSEEALNAMNDPLAIRILEVKKILKVKDTYIDQFLREEFKGRLHPMFGLDVARTSRGNCQHPNFQNIPVRNKKMKKLVRSGIGATPGMQFGESDYGSQEVRFIAIESQDPVLVKEILNDYDMHKEMAHMLFNMPLEEVSKDLRFCGKNGATFPLFYGSYFVNVAKDVWEKYITQAKTQDLKTTSDIYVDDWLKSKGILTYERFEDHCRKVENWFWDKYQGVKKWQKESQEFYNKHGYLPMLFGHRRGGWLKRNKIYNSKIQGPAFHVLADSLVVINERLHDENWKTRLCAQIHDCINANIYPDETSRYLKLLQDCCCDRVQREYDWCIVPLIMEHELCPVGKPWFYKVEVIEHEGEWIDKAAWKKGEGERIVLAS